MQANHFGKRLTRSFIASDKHLDVDGLPVQVRIIEQRQPRREAKRAIGRVTRVVHAVSPQGISDDAMRQILNEQVVFDSGSRRASATVHKVKGRVWKVIGREYPQL
ncbi:hypothetical protein [Noviherbaspirillum pedocola]|uniref:Uncharacterized protein n=1 Tax=Noviherbaspirillum pedocola TaxID=2801341 RepID=A0A934SZN4_9BURK|nr:hypothetical protein [Noviherbaspirillum pedocola]MBK4735962.1 hypothetical protein [Noviherbaspirillum pedocola]